MLTPKQLDNIPTSLVNLYTEVELAILADMARRLSKMDFIPSAAWQYKKLSEMGLFHDQALKMLSDVSGLRLSEIKSLMEEAGVETIKSDSVIYHKMGLSPNTIETSPALQSVLLSGIENTNGLFENLTQTTANTATKQFENSLDRAWLKITSGAFDYNTAIQSEIKDLASKGIESINYPSGKKEYIETAVRRATLTGVNQTALKLQDNLADEMDSDLVEVTAHAGARVGNGVANHAGWQGKIYSRSGTHPKYPSLRAVAGYGTGPGLGGWNCRHSFHPTFEGMDPVYTKSELEAMNAPKYEYKGEKLTEYEANQKQRYIERNIRKCKREYVCMNAAGQPADEAAAKLAKWKGIQKDFLEKTGLKRNQSREFLNEYDDKQIRIDKLHQADIIKNVKFKELNSAKEVNAFFGGEGSSNKKSKSAELQWLKGLTRNEKDAVTAYCDKAFYDLNDFFRQADDWEYTNIDELNELANDLDNAIAKFDLRENITVYRGVDKNAMKGLNSHHIGQTYHDLGYMSTTALKSNVSEIFDCRDALLVIQVPKGKGRGAYINSLSGYKDKEYEFLLPRNTKCIITNVIELNNKRIIEMRVLDNG